VPQAPSAAVNPYGAESSLLKSGLIGSVAILRAVAGRVE